MTTTNHQFKLATRPVGAVKRSDFNYTEEALREPAAGEVLIKVLHISLDPAMRGWMDDRPSYMPPVAINEVMRALAVGRVIASNNPGFAVGDHVSGMLGVQEYAYSNGQGINKVDPKLAPLPMFLGTLGMPGLTAYFGLLDIGMPKEGETVVVSGAAGAVGAVVGQIAKIKGCRVVGIAGGKDKCDYLVNELGFDAAIDYKDGNVATALREHAPKGVDIYFDNVGGDILDAVLTNLARDARIVLCGGISQYNNTSPVKGPANYLSMISARATMKGLMVADYYHRAGSALQEMGGWLMAGKLKSREDIVKGIETFPDTFNMLFSGANKGKLVLQVAAE